MPNKNKHLSHQTFRRRRKLISIVGQNFKLFCLLSFDSFGKMVLAAGFNLNLPPGLQGKVAISIYRADNYQAVYQYRESTPMLLASNMKLLTSYVALNQLGPNFSWPTQIAYTGKINNGVLSGNVYIIGGGNPTLRSNDINVLLSRLKNHGISSIQGNFYLDGSIFNQQLKSSELYPEPLAAYSVNPAGLIIDENLSTLSFSLQHKSFKIHAQNTAKLKFINQLKLSKSSAACPDPGEFVNIVPSAKNTFKVVGTMPAACSQESLPIYVLANFSFNKQIISRLLLQQHIKISGKISQAKYPSRMHPSEIQPIARVDSPTLAQILLVMNKDSNNLYAKTLFMSSGAYRSANQNTYADSKNIYLQTIAQHFHFPELSVENGSGLSRHEKLTTEDMTQFLNYMYHDSNAQIFMNSLPSPGESGTLQGEFLPFQHQLYAKTGSLADAKAYSGYFKAKTGQTYTLSFIANGINASDSRRPELIQFKQLLSTALESLNQMQQ